MLLVLAEVVKNINIAVVKADQKKEFLLKANDAKTIFN
jgi:hypothetical protein